MVIVLRIVKLNLFPPVKPRLKICKVAANHDSVWLLSLLALDRSANFSNLLHDVVLPSAAWPEEAHDNGNANVPRILIPLYRQFLVGREAPKFHFDRGLFTKDYKCMEILYKI